MKSRGNNSKHTRILLCIHSLTCFYARVILCLGYGGILLACHGHESVGDIALCIYFNDTILCSRCWQPQVTCHQFWWAGWCGMSDTFNRWHCDNKNLLHWGRKGTREDPHFKSQEGLLITAAFSFLFLGLWLGDFLI